MGWLSNFQEKCYVQHMNGSSLVPGQRKKIRITNLETGLRVITADKVLHLEYAIVDAQSVPLLDGVVRRAFLSTRRHCLRAADQSIYRHLVVIDYLNGNVSRRQRNRRVHDGLVDRGHHRCRDRHDAGARLGLHQLRLNE